MGRESWHAMKDLPNLPPDSQVQASRVIWFSFTARIITCIEL